MKQFLVILAAVALAACGKSGGGNDKEAVRQGVIDYLAQRSNLNINSMNVEVTSVKFNGEEAEATVSFSPKGSKEAGGGMSMPYTLEKKGGRWVVKARSSQGHGGSAPPAGAPESPGAAAPPAHPPGQPPAGDLPPGHPPVGSQKKK